VICYAVAPRARPVEHCAFKAEPRKEMAVAKSADP
jgi:hypothetical protein